MHKNVDARDTWNIMEDVVPNLHTMVIPCWIDRLGDMCKLDSLKSSGAVRRIKGGA